MKNKLLLLSFVSVVIVAAVHLFATAFYLYWTIWWFDNVTHFLGGLAIGFFSIYIFKKFYRFKPEAKARDVVFVVIFLVVVIGIGWEAFELVMNLPQPFLVGETHWQDINYDLVSDLVGALMASLVIYKKKLYV